jgi:hypothetical protein
MADEDIQPIVCDNGTGMVKVVMSKVFSTKQLYSSDLIVLQLLNIYRPVLLVMMHQELSSPALWEDHAIPVSWLAWAKRMPM